MSKKAKELIADGNDLAGKFYRLMVCRVLDGYRFDKSDNLMERACWDMAVVAYRELRAIDLRDALAEMDED